MTRSTTNPRNGVVTLRYVGYRVIITYLNLPSGTLRRQCESPLSRWGRWLPRSMQIVGDRDDDEQCQKAELEGSITACLAHECLGRLTDGLAVAARSKHGVASTQPPHRFSGGGPTERRSIGQIRSVDSRCSSMYSLNIARLRKGH